MDPITTISGPLDQNAFVDNTATASGESTLNEIVQLINKVNEIVPGLNETALLLGSTISDLNQADAGLDVRLDAAEASITALGAADTALDLRVDTLEATAASYGTKSYVNASQTLSDAEVLGYRTLVCQKVNSTTTISLHLPGDAGAIGMAQPMQIVNMGFTNVQIDLSDETSTWGDGKNADYFLLVPNQGFVTIMPVESTTVQGATVWLIIGGSRAYANLQS